MHYEVQLIPLNKTITTPMGFLEPLCNNCLASDCENPIRELSMSVVGQIKKCRVWYDQGIAKQVVSCKGYTNIGIEEK